MKIIAYLNKMIIDDVSALQSQMRIEPPHGNDCQNFEKGEKISNLISAFDLSPADVACLLFRAVRTNKNVALAGILDYGNSCNSADERGDTPLHWAVRAGQAKAVKLLLDHGADPFLKNHQDLNAIFYAIKQPEIYAHLKERYLMINTLASGIFLMYEQAIKEGNDVTAEILLEEAVKLKYEPAVKVMNDCKHDCQKDSSVRWHSHTLFTSTNNKENQEQVVTNPSFRI